MTRIVRQDISYIEEGIALQADVDERGIHTRQHVLDDPLEDRAHDSFFTLNAVFLQLAIFQYRDSGLALTAIDDDFYL